MSDPHKDIRDRVERGVDFGNIEIQWFDEGLWRSAPNPLWTPSLSYRLLSLQTGKALFTSMGTAGLYPDPAIERSPLTPTEYLDGCVKAAIALLMKPERSTAEVRKARAWLTLGLEGADK